MDPGEPPQATLTLPGQLHQDAPAVGGIDVPAQNLQFCHPIHQLDRGVVSDQEIVREIADGEGGRASRSP